MRIATLTCMAAALVASPALAQDTTAAEPPADTAPAAEANAGIALTAEQQAAYDAWPPAEQAQYGAWPADTQTYFWTLTPERRELFWRISDANKVTLAGLPAAQQEQAWTQIETQAAAMASGGAAVGTPAAPTAEPPEPTTEGPAATWKSSGTRTPSR